MPQAKGCHRCWPQQKHRLSQAQVDALQVQILGGGDCAEQPVPSRQLGPASGAATVNRVRRRRWGEAHRER